MLVTSFRLNLGAREISLLIGGLSLLEGGFGIERRLGCGGFQTFAACAAKDQENQKESPA